MTYKRFAAMIAASTVAMFILMYSMVYRLGHVFWSDMNFFMALYMGATMALIMMGFMWGMYSNRKVKGGILAASVVVFAVFLYLARSQATIGDIGYMEAMIPHHSIAILTSERAHISDPRVRALADEIISSQKREIAEMKVLIEDLKQE